MSATRDKAPLHVQRVSLDLGETQSATLGLESELIRTCRKLGVSIHGTQPP